MAFFIGSVVGSILLIWLVTLVLGKFAMKDADPDPRAFALTGMAFVFAVMMGVWGSNGIIPAQIAAQVVAALIVWRLYLAQLRKTHITDATPFE